MSGRDGVWIPDPAQSELVNRFRQRVSQLEFVKSTIVWFIACTRDMVKEHQRHGAVLDKQATSWEAKVVSKSGGHGQHAAVGALLEGGEVAVSALTRAAREQRTVAEGLTADVLDPLNQAEQGLTRLTGTSLSGLLKHLAEERKQAAACQALLRDVRLCEGDLLSLEEALRLEATKAPAGGGETVAPTPSHTPWKPPQSASWDADVEALGGGGHGLCMPLRAARWVEGEAALHHAAMPLLLLEPDVEEEFRLEAREAGLESPLHADRGDRGGSGDEDRPDGTVVVLAAPAPASAPALLATAQRAARQLPAAAAAVPASLKKHRSGGEELTAAAFVEVSLLCRGALDHVVAAGAWETAARLLGLCRVFRTSLLVEASGEHDRPNHEHRDVFLSAGLHGHPVWNDLRFWEHAMDSVLRSDLLRIQGVGNSPVVPAATAGGEDGVLLGNGAAAGSLSLGAESAALQGAARLQFFGMNAAYLGTRWPVVSDLFDRFERLFALDGASRRACRQVIADAYQSSLDVRSAEAAALAAIQLPRLDMAEDARRLEASSPMASVMGMSNFIGSPGGAVASGASAEASAGGSAAADGATDGDQAGASPEPEVFDDD